ncbi:hypothetical protein FLM55_00950 [Francisella sp. Scap27]|uniref:hypothetical protein n=1 Tax=Francisella sp. Scap27 TaxID=2589986 RepID=UPI0015BA1651|nr:hypothetical protein [Francisella sp. Scap27]QLE78380.1 hypothetical protein FLM55_00950 [Francisella sp. Scap27]
MNKIVYIGLITLVTNIAMANETSSYNGWDFVPNKIGAQYNYKITIKKPDNKIISESHLWKNLISCRNEGSDKCVHLLNFVKPTDKKLYYTDYIYKNTKNGVFSTLITKKPKNVKDIETVEVFKPKIVIGNVYVSKTKDGVESKVNYKHLTVPKIIINGNKYANCIKSVSEEKWQQAPKNNQPRHKSIQETIYCKDIGEVESTTNYYMNNKLMMSSAVELLSIKYPFK